MPHATEPIINTYNAFAKICLDKNQEPFFRYNSIEQNEFFYDMKKNYNEFEKLVFDTNGHSPFSDTIDEARFDLMISGKWNYIGIMYEKVLLTKKSIEEDFEKIENKETFLEIGQKFYNKFYTTP